MQVIAEVQNAGGPWEALEVSPSAASGGYKLPRAPSAETFEILKSGRVAGWRMDFNGRDWTLPPEAGSYALRVRVDLRLQDTLGSKEPAEGIKDLLGFDWKLQMEKVPDQELVSNEIHLERRSN